MSFRTVSQASETHTEEKKYLLQESKDGITLQVRNILLQIRLLLSLVSDPVQHLKGNQVC